MSTASIYFDAPRFSTAHVERLAIERPREIGNRVWTEVHEEVQRVLKRLDELVQSSVAHLRVESGRTQGCSFHLFTYRTFSRMDAIEIDPVVVGLTFTRPDSDETDLIIIDADISGESTGDGITILGLRRVPAVREELLRAAHESASELSYQGQRIVEALFDSSRST